MTSSAVRFRLQVLQLPVRVGQLVRAGTPACGDRGTRSARAPPTQALPHFFPGAR